VGDLRRNPVRLRQLADFIRGREGVYLYFYCDNFGHVTIGIGTLVATEQVARRIAGDPAVRFTFRQAPLHQVTVDDVAADWGQVRDRPGLRTAQYAEVTQLRLDDASATHLLTQEITRSARALYDAHPFLVDFSSLVAMAFVDTRYNPAGLNPYNSPETQPLWAALDPHNPQFNLDTAVSLFERLWANRGGRLAERYAGRHWQRTQWFRQGLQAMGAPALRSVPN
jgi:GH24 family phage-related lysozyme (muramidase)